MRLRTCVMMVGFLVASPFAKGQNSAVDWWAMDMGFASTRAGNLGLRAVAGQAFGGVTKSGNVLVHSGLLSDSLLRRGAVTAIRSQEGVPLAYELSQNYPNPFNPTTTIEFSLPKAGHVTVAVFDMLGREIERLVDGDLAAGRYRSVWNARGYSSGMYVYRLQAGEFVAVKKLILVR